MLSSTPWGEPQTRREIAPGICFYSTARHGGYHLSPDRFETFRQFFPDYVLWAGDPWLRKIVTRHLSRSRSPQSSPIRVYFLRSKAYALASNVSELPILLGYAYGPPSLTTRRSSPFYTARTSSGSSMPTTGKSVVPAQTIKAGGMYI